MLESVMVKKYMKDHVSNDCVPNNLALNTEHLNVIKPNYTFI